MPRLSFNGVEPLHLTSAFPGTQVLDCVGGQCEPVLGGEGVVMVGPSGSSTPQRYTYVTSIVPVSARALLPNNVRSVVLDSGRR
jgi:hypothetical protein